MNPGFKGKIPYATVLLIFVIMDVIINAVMFTMFLAEWSIHAEQTEGVRKLVNNPQTSIEEQKQSFADMKTVIKNQQIIIDYLTNKSSSP